MINIDDIHIRDDHTRFRVISVVENSTRPLARVTVAPGFSNPNHIVMSVFPEAQEFESVVVMLADGREIVIENAVAAYLHFEEKK